MLYIMEHEQEYFDKLLKAGYSLEEIEVEIIRIRLEARGSTRC